MSETLWFVVACGVLALLYGVYASRSVLSASPGNERMQEIAAAIQVGANAYLNRQYTTIAIVGAVVFALLWVLLGLRVGIGFLIGAVLSAAAGYIGMNVSVRANVRTAEAARQERRGPEATLEGKERLFELALEQLRLARQKQSHLVNLRRQELQAAAEDLASYNARRARATHEVAEATLAALFMDPDAPQALSIEDEAQRRRALSDPEYREWLRRNPGRR